MTTDYHAKYFAHALNQVGGNGMDRLGRALFDACVDLNPHQIEAALFALRSPISKGVLLADEVGLGKTIEAGLVICQYWAEHRRRILVICPASLRKQWAMELEEKFNLPNLVLDEKAYRESEKKGIFNPFQADSVVICSMHYASRKAEAIKSISWDLVVIDEAHKLRNAYRQSNRMGQQLRWATEDRKKLLLTATPLQNSLLELYGLSTLIDDHLFGDLPSFRTQYVNQGGDPPGLRERLQSFCWRTLRSQVLEYIRYTERKLITRPFKPTEQEQSLYEAVSRYLQREDNYALPGGQRHLLVLVVRKVLASSPRALAGTLEVMHDRLLKMRQQWEQNATWMDRIMIEDELDEDLLNEILEDQEDMDVAREDSNDATLAVDTVVIDIQKLNNEIEELEQYIRWARSISVDTKTRALLKALEIGFHKMNEMGAVQKAVIFTESRRTQLYLKEFLEANTYFNSVITFNGSNRDLDSIAIYNEWVENNRESGRASGSRAVDLRTAIIDEFCEKGQILIATEAAAEGINLQFCSLVINYDLPWNPQRIEQRIGRCHRYGQLYDVVVINFLNESNQADRRAYELLEHKFNLFSGVFGASDDVLGSIESGVDFERRVLEIYQQCRTTEEIEAAFQELQERLEEQIQTRMKNTRHLLLEHFDEDVHERLRVNLSGAQDRLDRIGWMFWMLSHHILKDRAEFHDLKLAFDLLESPRCDVRPGYYHLISKERDNVPGEFLYRLSHPLGEYVIAEGLERQCPAAHLIFNYSEHPTRISVVEELKGKSGWLILQKLCIDSFEREDYLLFSAFDETGRSLDSESCAKLFNCAALVNPESLFPPKVEERLIAEAEQHARATMARSLEENNRHFNEVRDQLDKWAEDMVKAVEKELDDVKRQIRDLQRRSRQAPTMEEQHQLQEEVVKMERRKRKLREKIFDVEDEIAEKRDHLIDGLEKRLQQKTERLSLFKIQWTVV